MEKISEPSENINFSNTVWAHIADEIEKKPTIQNTKNLARAFVCAATFITTDSKGNNLFNNRQLMIDNAQEICATIKNPELKQTFITEAQEDYLLQEGLNCQKMPQSQTSSQLIAAIEHYRALG